MQTPSHLSLLAMLLLLAAAASARAHSIHLAKAEHTKTDTFSVGRTLHFGRPSISHILPPDGTANGTGGANGTAGLWGGILEMGQFYAAVGVGNQTFRVQVDTGSSTLAVPMEGCSCGHHADLPYKRTADTHDVSCSASVACTFDVGYLDGSGMKGVFLEDALTLGGLTARGPFGAMKHTSKKFEGTVDGILGAARSSLNCFPTGTNQCNPTIFDTLRQAGKVKANRFGMCLDSAHGRWDLGEFDSQYAEDDYKWAQLQSLSGFYEVSMSSLTLGGSAVSNAGVSVVADSGTTLAVLPQDAMQSVQFMLNELSPPGFAEMVQGDGCAALSDGEVQQWPTLTYTIQAHGGGSVDVDLGPAHYLLELDGRRCFALQSANTGGQHILGDIFLNQFYTAYDLVNDRIGFAPVRLCESIGDPPEATGPWCGGCDGDDSRTTDAIIGAFVVAAVIGVFVLIIVRKRRQQASAAANQPFLRNEHTAPSTAQGGHYTQVA